MDINEKKLRYSRSHEWALLEDNGLIRIGITEHAQRLLGDMVFIELPDLDSVVEAENECAVAESVKAAVDIYSPLSGEVVEVNEALMDKPQLVNSDPYGEGWVFLLKPSDEQAYQGMLDHKAYSALINKE